MIPFPVLCAEEIAVMRALILHMFRHDSLEIVSMPSCTWHDPSPGFPQTPSHLCDLCRHFIQTSYQLGRQRLNEYLRFFPSLLQIFEYFIADFQISSCRFLERHKTTYIPNLRIESWRKVEIRNFTFPSGFLDCFEIISSLATLGMK